MLSIAEWTDRALALSSPKKLTSSASFSPSIRISLRLKIHQAQAKNFCRVLDIRVAQIVVTGVRTANRRDRFLIVAVDCRLCQVMPQGIGKHQIVALPSAACHETLLCLFRLAMTQVGDHHRRRHQCAAATILGRNQLVGRKALFLMKLELLVHGDHAVVKVYTIPGQSQCLALPQDKEQRGQKEILKGMSLNDPDKSGHIVLIQRLDFCFLPSR